MSIESRLPRVWCSVARVRDIFHRPDISLDEGDQNNVSGELWVRRMVEPGGSTTESGISAHMSEEFWELQELEAWSMNCTGTRRERTCSCGAWVEMDGVPGKGKGHSEGLFD